MDAMGPRILMFALVCGSVAPPAGGTVVQDLAGGLDVTYEVVDNLDAWTMKITLMYTGSSDVISTDWHIYFFNIRDITQLKGHEYGAPLGTSGINASHVTGALFRLTPTASFSGFVRNSPVELPFNGNVWTAARTDAMPNWYVSSPDGVETAVMTSTAGEQLGFVPDFTTKNQWKRTAGDLYDPFTAQTRRDHYSAADRSAAGGHAVPRPQQEALHATRAVTLHPDSWVVVGDTTSWETNYLADQLGMRVVPPSHKPPSHYIQTLVGSIAGTLVIEPESYRVAVNDVTNSITVTGYDAAGVLYGVQTVLSLCGEDSRVPHGTVTDRPRQQYRGMHMDVSRNFRPKEDVLQLLDVMAMYKLNKFHFHLTDDEGWRLEIPGLPELTAVGGNQCHDTTGDRCIMPQLGSGPSISGGSGSGAYTREDYREILQYAHRRHITVIPEFDMPGHAHAAINAMLARYRSLKDSNMTAATEFLLSDQADTSQYLSVQMFTDNAINPCINSTYRFVRRVYSELQAMHADIQPLQLLHFGGDEVPHTAWVGSPQCQALNSTGTYKDTAAYMQLFVTRVAVVAGELGLTLAAWEDGFLGDGPYDVSLLGAQPPHTYTWNNVWEWGSGDTAYKFANAGYKVVLSHATHLYFDHPYEPDPEDRGYYWAPRCTDTHKVFGYSPKDIYSNMDVTRMGAPQNKTTVCANPAISCTQLQADKKDNIIGMQGHLWSETVRTRSQFHYMVFPRLVALAERAWHEASWESLPEGADRDTKQDADWERFANALGHRELRRLDKRGISYEVPPPGARILAGNVLDARTAYPGLPIYYSSDTGSTWHRYTEGAVVDQGELLLHTRSADGSRYSRQVPLSVTAAKPDVTAPCSTTGGASRLTPLSLLVSATITLLATGLTQL